MSLQNELHHCTSKRSYSESDVEKLSTHHFLWKRADYRTHHEKLLRRYVTVETDWERHCELHANMQPPKKPDIGITLTLIDYFDEQKQLTEPAPLYAVDRLLRLGSEEAVELADHFITQLAYLGIGYGRE